MDATRAAHELWSAWLEERTIGALPEDRRPRTLAEGYAVQRALAELAGPAVGWKLAATSAAGQRHIGVDGPLVGRLFERFLHEAPVTLPAGGAMGVLEAEFAFRLGCDLPRRDEPYTRDETMAAVGALHLAIEVPDSRLADFERAGAAQLAADDACAGLFVLGPEASSWRGLDLSKHAVEIRRNGQVAGTGSGGNVLGDPRDALAWLASHEHGSGLAAGEVVTTGTTTVPVAYAPGDELVADFGALGSVAVSFATAAGCRGS